jgi:hypothetical protein
MEKGKNIPRKGMTLFLDYTQDQTGIRWASCSGTIEYIAENRLNNAEHRAKEIRVNALMQTYTLPRETAEVLNDLSKNYRVPLIRVAKTFQKYGIINNNLAIAGDNHKILKALKELEEIGEQRNPAPEFYFGSEPKPHKTPLERTQRTYQGDSGEDLRERLQSE